MSVLQATARGVARPATRSTCDSGTGTWAPDSASRLHLPPLRLVSALQFRVILMLFVCLFVCFRPEQLRKILRPSHLEPKFLPQSRLSRP